MTTPNEAMRATDEQVLNAVRAYVNAGKRGCNLQEAMRHAVEAAALSAQAPAPQFVSQEEAEEIRGELKEAAARGRSPDLDAMQCNVLVDLLDAAMNKEKT